MHRRLGGPLPHQLANAPQDHLYVVPVSTFNKQEMPLAYLSGFSLCFQRLSRSYRQVPHVLLTRSPLRTEVLRSTCMY